MSYVVPGPGIYGLVRDDGALHLWKNRARDGSRTSWPIWHSRPTSRRVFDWPAKALGVPVPRHEGVLYVYDFTVEKTARWSPVRLGDDVRDPISFQTLRDTADELIWWTSARNNKERRALYLPKMPRDELIALATDLERRAGAGAKHINHQPIGVWIRRVWGVIEGRERVEIVEALAQRSP